MKRQRSLFAAISVFVQCYIPSGVLGFSRPVISPVIRGRVTPWAVSQQHHQQPQRNREQPTWVLPTTPIAIFDLESKLLPEAFSIKQSTGTKTSNELPPILQQIADERENFNMNLGKAMDTLRKDMPVILHTSPDYSIYHENIEVIDPSGVRLTGLDKYKSAISFFQTFVKFWFSMERGTGLQYRMVYDFCRSAIRVSWHAVLIPKIPGMKPLFVDGVSLYHLDRNTGKITEHKIEKLLMNNKKVIPPYSIFSLLQENNLIRIPSPQGNGVPVGVGVGAGMV